MNKTIALTAFVMFAAILTVAPLAASVDAVKMDKVDICHFSEAEIEIDSDTGEEVVIYEEEWVPININDNAVDKHLQNHGDLLIDNSDEPVEGTVTTDGCLALNEPETETEL